MSLPYTKLPVYIGTYAVDANYYVPATQVDVNYNTTHSPKRKLGSNIGTGDQFGFDGALTAEINVNSLVHEDMELPFGFAERANYANDTYVVIGDNVFSKCYPVDLSVQINPFEPVRIQTKFVSLDPPTGEQISGTGWSNFPITGDDIAYGKDCVVYAAGIGASNVINDVQSNITFNRRYARTPTFELGSINASQMLLDGVEEDLVISSTGLEQLIDFSGQVLNDALNIQIQNVGAGMSAPINNLIEFNKGSRVLYENYAVVEGETVKTSATIKQIKL